MILQKQKKNMIFTLAQMVLLNGLISLNVQQKKVMNNE